jgi:hypothetical protein
MNNLIEILKKDNNTDIRLLRMYGVVEWIFNDLTFLEYNSKKCEDDWGRKCLQTVRPDLKVKIQWTHLFGEIIVKEIYILLGETVFKPTKKNGFLPDLETNNLIIEVKTGTYKTAGTAHEKILGVMFKYIDLPIFYTKPLRIVCVGEAERVCKDKYGNIGSCSSENKRELLEFVRSKNIEYVGCTELINRLNV